MELKVDRRSVIILFIALAVSLLLFGVGLHFGKITGYNVVTAEGGSVTGLNIEHARDTEYWAGYYGLLLRLGGFSELQDDVATPGSVDVLTIVVDCLEPDVVHELYASTVDPTTLDFSTAQAGTAQMVADFINYSGSPKDAPNETFIYLENYTVSNILVQNVPTTYTKVLGVDNNTDFPTGILNISGNLVFVTKKTETLTSNFKNTTSNIQFMVPVPNASTLYYFVADPGDTCPAGSGIGVSGNGFIIGYASDEDTGVRLDNVSVSAGGVQNYTNASGWYNITAPLGVYNIIGAKDGYITHVGQVNVTLNSHYWHNFTLVPFGLFTSPNGTINGSTFDNQSLASIPNVQIYLAGRSFTSDGSGLFIQNVSAGTHDIIAVAPNYYNFIGSVTINQSNITQYPIAMDSLFGTLYGRVIDTDSSLGIDSVQILAGGQSTFTNSSGDYSFQVPAGTLTAVATKPSYTIDAAVVNISAGGLTNQNFSIRQDNATFSGTVFDNTTRSGVASANVYVVDQTIVTNNTGNFTTSTNSGRHIMYIYKPGYDIYVTNVTIGEGISQNQEYYIIPSNGTLNGTVYDSFSGDVVENAILSINGRTVSTNNNGTFNFTTLKGTFLLSITKTGYQNYLQNVTIYPGETTTLNVTIDQVTGSINGTVRNANTLALLSNATISIFGNVVDSNASGLYAISNIAVGTHTISATKSGYSNFVSNVTIVSGETLQFEINLTPVDDSAIPGVQNGSIKGYTLDSDSSGISTALVYVGGKNNITDTVGRYNITNIPATNQTLVAVKSGYLTTVSAVYIETGGTEFNVTLLSTQGMINGTVTNAIGSELDEVNVTISGESYETNSTGEYELDVNVGTYNLVAVKSGYKTYTAIVQINSSNTTTHDIELETQDVTGAGPGLGDGLGAGLGAGQGEGTGIVATPSQPVQPVEERDGTYDLSFDRILKKVRHGSFITFPFVISNFRNSPITVDFEVTGTAADVMTMDPLQLNIGPTDIEQVLITILGNADPNLYNGSLILSGDIDQEIPVDILIYGKDRLPIETLQMNLEVFDKSVEPGDILRYRLDLNNLLREEEYKVALTYSIEDPETGNIVPIETEDILIETSLSLLKDMEIPNDLDAQDYLLRVDARYIEFDSSVSSTFTVVLPFYRYAVFGVIPVWIIFVAILVAASGTFGYFEFKRQQAKKKRYHLQVDYNALPPEGPRTAYAGLLAETTKKVYFDLDLFQVHTLIAGSSGSGKTVAAQGLVEEALMKGAAAIIFDPTAQWSGFLRKMTDKKMIALYSKFGFKPTDARGFNGNVRQITDSREYLDIKKYMKPGEMTVFAINKLTPDEIDVLVANTVKQVFSANLPESKTLKLIVIFDEVHRLLPKFGGKGEGFVQIERATREFRKWGVALMLISQVLKDFIGETKANINTEIQMRTRDEGDLNRIKEEYGDAVLQALVKASMGTGMVENSAYNNGKPFMVSFRPLLHNIERLPDSELEQYNKYNDMVDAVEFELDQLKESGMDIFDFTLELKLAKDKIKSGNFNMVEIYLDGLKPRVQAAFKKAGITPKKYEKKLIDIAELDDGSEEESKDKKSDDKKEDSKSEEESKEEPKPEQKKEETKQENKPKEEEQSEPAEESKQPAAENSQEPASEEQKKEQEPSEQKQETAPDQEKTPTKQAAEVGSDLEITGIIKKMNDLAAQNQIDQAKTMYPKLQEMYKSLNPETKQGILPQIADLQRKLK